MKKSTKKTIAALVIILIFGMSSIAFIVTSAFPGGEQEQFQPLTNFVVEGDIDPAYEATYVQNGFTWMKFYYEEADPIFLSFIDSLPATYVTGFGQQQLVVQKINSAYGNSSQYAAISSLQGLEEIENPDEVKLTESLCRLLVVTPSECGFLAIQNLPGQGSSQAANDTESNETEVGSAENQTVSNLTNASA